MFPSYRSAEPAARVDPATSGIRKARIRLIPLLALGYGIAYIDRVNISFAALQMNRDLHFTATNYGLGAGLFFLGYAACELPSTLLLYRFGARRWLARIMITWGIIAVCMTLVRTPWQFCALRLLLGIAEAGFFPGVIFYEMQWFPPALRGRSVTGFYVALPLSTVVMGALAGSLLGLNGRLSLAGWQWLFLVEALPAVLLGVVYLLYLPDGPRTAKWLSPAERIALSTELSEPVPGAHSESIAPAVRDARVWLLGAFMFCMLTSMNGYVYSAPTIIQKATGYSAAQVGFVVAGFGMVAASMMILGGIVADRARDSAVWVIAECIIMTGGLLALAFSSGRAGVFPSLVLIASGYYLLQGPVWSISTAFLNGRCAAAGIALINSIGSVGGFVGPYWMGYARDLTGNYQRGLVVDALPMVLAAILMVCIRHIAHPTLAPIPQAAAAPELPT